MLTREDLLAIEGILAPRFDAIDEKFEGVTKRLDEHDKRFDRLEHRMEHQESQLGRLEGRMGRLELRIEHLESDVSALRYGQLDLKKAIEANYKKIEETYDLALENFGQIEESKTRLNLLEQ